MQPLTKLFLSLLYALLSIVSLQPASAAIPANGKSSQTDPAYNFVTAADDDAADDDNDDDEDDDDK